ncbi:MAG TPA: GNAT family N-acetyltransferase [Blastocatellia bacterium]|nr:GNAT family N-acetyltransferase [Blastocatellia bacterium]
MASIALQEQNEASGPQTFSVVEDSLSLERLGDECKAEVLSFLSAQPLRTVFLAGFIHDHGLESPKNQGAFYACRNREGKLEGVALIGRVILFETDSESALKAFARVAHGCNFTRVILGEQKKTARFWRYYSTAGQALRRRRRQLLFEQQWPIQAHDPVPALRVATAEDLPLILPVTNELIFEESGDRPLETDPEGFARRWLSRIEQGRVLVWIENERLIFNVDIICETPDVIYLEGVHVHPEERGKGYGLRCLSQVGRSLLKRSRSICLLASDSDTGAHAFYRSAGYKLRGYYDTLFLNRNS